eukprot:TRINITY_DN405_c0_g1_i1.p2 TRINITY_DN405_c0_g1~~TRINITY_DN405_c0_g1_i1.p2  ORF type:complete len:171 (+),score=41.37 TRINITY_DN405_c0_g1_i1:140-652(+)
MRLSVFIDGTLASRLSLNRAIEFHRQGSDDKIMLFCVAEGDHARESATKRLAVYKDMCLKKSPQVIPTTKIYVGSTRDKVLVESSETDMLFVGTLSHTPGRLENAVERILLPFSEDEVSYLCRMSTCPVWVVKDVYEPGSEDRSIHLHDDEATLDSDNETTETTTQQIDV